MSDSGTGLALVPTVRVWAGRFMGGLLCAMAVFSPWAFGTTQEWSIAAMNVAGCILAILFFVRLFATRDLLGRADRPARRLNFIVAAVAALSVLLLLYVLTSAWNAAAAYVPDEWRLQERPHIAWLPHSFDGPATWKILWRYFALAGVFWAAWDWLSDARRSVVQGEVPRLSSHLRTLLWACSVSGALLALEAIFQRVSGTPNLLWLMPTHENKDAVTQFGPFAYRANGAQFVNLIWPVTLGFWWWLHQDQTQRVTRRGLHHVLLPCVVVMAASALFSLSRGGVAVAGLMLVGAGLVFALARSVPMRQRILIILLIAATAVAGILMSWQTLSPRLRATMGDPLRGRTEIYETARQMAADYTWLGMGAGTFDSLFQMYRRAPEQYWPGQVHDDWLEFRITLGRIGFGLALAALAVAWSRCLFRGGVPREPAFLTFVTMSLAGCLLHAKYDFPLQIYSIQFHFLIFLAIAFSSSRPKSA